MRNITFYRLTIVAFLLVSCGQVEVKTETPTIGSPTSVPPNPTPTTQLPPTETMISMRDTVTPTPTTIPTITPTYTPEPAEPHSEFPAIVYMRYSDVIFSNFDGSAKTTLPYVADVSYPQAGSDVAPQSGTVVLRATRKIGSLYRDSIWVIQPGESPVELASHRREDSIEHTPITLDSSMVAYAVHGWSTDVHQLWIVNTDASNNRLLVNETSRFITDPGPFRLVPIAWSADNSKIYLTTNTDSEATPVGMYVADLATGEITKAKTPQVTLWGLSFSADRSKIAYTTFQWVPTEDGLPGAGPPFTLNATNIESGQTTVLLSDETDRYARPIWSPDGTKLAFTIIASFEEGDAGLFVLDLRSGAVSTVILGERGVRITPNAWLSDDVIAYTREGTSQSSLSGSQLLTIRTDGSDQHLIEEGNDIYVLGVVPQSNP